jgi:hypothetical protein
MGIDKEESRRIRNDIRQVLLQVWDPIGIQDEPNAQDEYDLYVDGIYGLLLRGATDKEITNHLWRIIEERIEIHPQSGATERTIQALRAIQIPRP